jgi:phage terminase large subunit-like protein
MVDTAVDTETEMSQALRLEVSGLADDFFRALSKRELEHLPYWWDFWARPKQIAPPGNWTYWLLLAGRGFGKTRSISEWVIRKAREMPGSRGAIVGQTAGDVRDVLIEGESGILACSPPDFMPDYVASKRRLTWPNGTVATLFSAEKPDSMRGPQFHWAAVDELAAWRYEDAWSMLQFGLRLGENPQCAIATTPRPTPVIRGLVSDPHCVVTHGTTYENRANLAASFFEQIIRKYEGTRLGRQELLAHILDDTPGALWNRAMLDETRVLHVPALEKIVVAIDPAATTGTTGIVVVGVAKVGGVLNGYVLDDVTPEAGASPATWAATAVAAYSKWRANLIVAEANQGGEMVRHTIHTMPDSSKLPVKLVRATRGKYTRAEPVGALYEQGRAHMVGSLAKLEDELCTWVPGEESPNRLDAMVWGFTELMVDTKPEVPHIAPTGLGKISKWGN